MRDIIKLGLTLMVFALIAGALLAFVYLKTAPIIAANKEAAMGGDTLLKLLPGMAGGFEKQGADTDFPYWVGYTDAGKTTIGGYVFTAKGKGYSSVVETLVGVDPNQVITGAAVVFQSETPGLGDKVQEVRSGEDTPWFTRQFVGKSSTDNLKVTKDGGVIDAISGATISSRAVTNSIATGLKNLSAVLAGGTAVVTAEPEAPAEPPATFVLPSDKDLAEVLPKMTGGFSSMGDSTEFPVWTGFRDAAKKTPGGYVFVARKKGFSSTVHTLIATDPAGKIVGIKTLFQEETPGYGDKMTEIKSGDKTPWFPRQFVGKSATDKIALKADGGTIDALTGATISSKAVTESVAEGLTNLKDALAGKTFPKYAGPIAGAAAAATPKPEQKPAVSTDTAMKEVLPKMASYQKNGDASFTWWTGYTDAAKTKVGGYVVIAKRKGFASTIETMIGADPDGNIVGIKTLFQEETPGYGDRMLEIKSGEKSPWFTRQFVGKSPSDKIALKDDGGVIDAMTGATISSKAVTVSVATALKQLMEKTTGKPAEEETDDVMARLMAQRGGDDEPAASAPAVDEAPDAAAQTVLPGMAVYIKTTAGGFTYWIGYTDTGKTSVGGYLFIATGEGFASDVVSAVGVNPKGAILTVKTLSQKETPGYGDKILEVKSGETGPWFPRQFVGKSAADKIALKADGGVIDALTGATITSKAATVSIADGMTKLATAIK